MPFDLFDSAVCSLLKEEVLSFTEDKSFDSGGIIDQWVATRVSYALRRVGHWDSARAARRVEALFVIQKGPSAGLLSGITKAVSSSVRRVLRIGSSSLLHCPEMACCIGAMISLPDIATSAACGCNPVCNVWVKIS